MNITDYKIGELYLYEFAGEITLDKLLSINDKSVKTITIKGFQKFFKIGYIDTFPIKHFCKYWRELTPLEKIKYL